MVNKYNKKRKVGLRSASMRALALETTSSSVATVNTASNGDGVVLGKFDCGYPNVRVYESNPNPYWSNPNPSYCSSKIKRNISGPYLSSIDLDTIWYGKPPNGEPNGDDNMFYKWTPTEICKVNPNSDMCNFIPREYGPPFFVEPCFNTKTCN
jgi:hypothetical protein